MKPLSDADVFGQSSKPLTDEEVFGKTAQKPLSDDEVFGASGGTNGLLDNPGVPFKTVAPALAKGVLNTEEAVASETLRAMKEGASGTQFVTDVLGQPNPVGVLNAGAKQIVNAGKSLLADDEDIAAQEAKVRTLQGAGKEATADINSIMPENPSLPLRVATGVTTNLAQNSPGLAMSLLLRNPAPAMAGGVALSAGQASDTDLTVDPSDPTFSKKAELKSILAQQLGTAEAAFELLPTKFLVDKFGKDNLAQLAAGYLAREVPSELATTFTQSVSTKALAEPDKPIGQFIDELGSSLLETALVTPLTAGIQSGAAHGFGKLRDDEKARLLDEAKLAAQTNDKESGELATEALSTLEDAELMDTDINNISVHEFIPQPTFTPEVAALIESTEPLSDEAIAGMQASLPKPMPAPEVANDGGSWQGLDGALDTDAQIGNTQRVRNNADSYEFNPNDEIPRSERTISFGPEGSVGHTLGSVKAQPATYVIGEPTVDRSEDVLGGFHELFESLRSQFMPNSTLVIANESMPSRQNIGMMQKLPSGEYLIVPAFLRNFSALEDTGTQDAGTFNRHTKAKAFYNVFHEFGHALTLDRFLEGAVPGVAAAFMAESRTGQISPQTIAQLNPEQAALATEYNRIRGNLRNMTAAQFQAEWMSPALAVQRKLITDMRASPEMNAESFVRRLVSRGNPEIARLQSDSVINPGERIGNSQRIDAIQTALMNEYLSFDEFMAEQMARYAHEKKLGQSSKLASSDYFAGGIAHVAQEEAVRKSLINQTLEKISQSLQQLFIALKKGVKVENGQTFRIAANTAYATWIESLGKTSSTQVKTEVLGKAEKKTKKSSNSKMPKTRSAVELRIAVTFGKFSPKQKLELYSMIRHGELNTAEMRMVEILKSRILKQVDPDVEATDPDWPRMRTQSPTFKNWFGDWENSPEQASKIVDAKGRPLVVFHGTKADIETFVPGDIGVHFGDLLAAHGRLYRIASPTEAKVRNRVEMDEWRGSRDAEGGATWREKDDGMNIIPAYLNIRKPLEFGVEDLDMWRSPVRMADLLYAGGFITPAEAVKAGQSFEAVKQVLQAKGYDGMTYTNTVEGGTSFVAFEPYQIKSTNASKFDGSDNRIHAQVDLDQTTALGLEIATFSQTLKKYTSMGSLDKALHWFARMQWNLLQLQHLAYVHPEFEFLDALNNAFRQYQAVKSRLQATGENVATQWRDLGKEWDAKLARALEAEADGGMHWTELVKVGNAWEHRINGETMKKLKEHGLTLDTPGGKAAIEVYLQSKNVITTQLDAALAALKKRLSTRIADQNELVARLNSVTKKFAEIRQIPFLPRGDYGSFGFKITEYNGLEKTIVHRQMFESEAERTKVVELARKKLGKHQRLEIFNRRLGDENRVLLALPLEYLDEVADVLELTEDQVDQLTEMLIPVKQDKLLVPYMRSLERVGGGSKDRMRNFADFVWHNSTLIARTETQDAMTGVKRAVSLMKNQVNRATMDEPTRARMMKDLTAAEGFVHKTIDYALAPPNEWYTVRSTVALIYLWGGFKTALLNLFGLVTTWSSLVSKHGLMGGNVAMLKGLNDLKNAGLESFSLAKMRPEVRQLYDRALSEGFLDQSYAAHLAAAATDGTTQRLGNRSRWLREGKGVVGKVTQLGMLPFTLTEQVSRRLTFLAVAESMIAEAVAAKQKPNMDAIYLEATKQNDLLQNSYTLANRPQIMRGGTGTTSGLIPLATIFLSFMGHMAFHAYGGYQIGKERRQEMFNLPKDKGKLTSTQYLLLLLLVFGGYEALPGAENVLDILDAVFVSTNGKPLRQYIREGIKELPGEGEFWNDPRWWGKGLGGDVFGADVSGSLGIGRIIPGTDIAANPPESAKEAIGQAVTSIGGVAGGLLNWGVQFAIDASNGVPVEESMARFPGAIGAQFAASNWAKNGVTDRSGATVYEPSAGETFAKRLGFTPSGLSEKREEQWAVKQMVNYWSTRRENLQRAYNRAMDANDREAIADARQAVEEFNTQAHDSRMRLLPWQLNQNYREHKKSIMRKESGIPDRNVRNLTAEIEASFDEEE